MNRARSVRGRDLAAVFSLLLAACTARESSDASLTAGAPSAAQKVQSAQGAPDGAKAAICPSCEPESDELRLAGGESSDFEGSLDECVGFLFRDPVLLDDAVLPGFDVPAIRQILERDFSASFAWVPTPPAVPGDASVDATIVTGFSPETTITGSIQLLGSGEYLHLDPERCDVATGICPISEPFPRDLDCSVRKAPGWLELDVEVSLRTGDGAIDLGTTRGRAVVKSNRPISVSVGRLDLTQLGGALRLEPAHPGPYVGSLGIVISATPAGMRGSVSPRITPVDTSEGWVAAPLTGRWPKEDDCTADQLPIDATTEPGQAALVLMNQLFSRLREQTQAASPMPARWAGSPDSLANTNAPTELTIDVSDMVQPGCVDADRYLSFSASAHLATADGRLDVSTTLFGAGLHQEGTWADASLSWLWSETFVTEAALRSAGFAHTELYGSQGANVQLLDMYLQLFGMAYHNGSLFVQAVPECSLDPRCAGAGQACDQCGQPLLVDRLLWGISAGIAPSR